MQHHTQQGHVNQSYNEVPFNACHDGYRKKGKETPSGDEEKLELCVLLVIV